MQTFLNGFFSRPIIATVIWGCFALFSLDTIAQTDSDSDERVVHISISVDWEGRVLDEADLFAMRIFRECVPHVPLTQFLNAAYYTKVGADPEATTTAIRSVLLPIDELGLHIHPWRFLVEQSGVSVRSVPNLWGRHYVPTDPDQDYGHAVDISAYETEELLLLVRTSSEILEEAGFELSPSFRAGAWLAEPHVLQAVREEGFLIDSSATDHIWHDEIRSAPLWDRIDEVWPEITPESQPYLIETPAGPILEMPDTGALADYMTVDEMEQHIREAIDWLELSDSDLYVHIGFHQETAADYAPNVLKVVLRLEADVSLPIVFETLETAAEQAADDLGFDGLFSP